MNNGKFYIGILNNENNSLGIGKDSNYNNFGVYQSVES